MLKSAHISKTVLTVTVSGCLYLLSTTSGFAGFEWVPKERPVTQPAAPVASAAPQAPMQVMEAPVAHVTGEPLQDTAAPQATLSAPAPVINQPGQMMQQIPAQTPATASAQIIQQIPASAELAVESQVMTPSPFDPPAQAPTPMAEPILEQPVMAAPAPAPVAIPQRQAVIPEPMATPLSLVDDAVRPPLSAPPPIANTAQVQAMEEQQANAALEAEKLMHSMDVTETIEPIATPEQAPIQTPAPIAEQTPVIIPVITEQAEAEIAIESPAPQVQPAIDYTAQALAQTAELRQDSVAPTAQDIQTPAPVAQIANAPESISTTPDDSANLSIAEQAALKAEAAKLMLAERAAQSQTNAPIAEAQPVDTQAPTNIPALEIVEMTDGEIPAERQAEAEKEVIVLAPIDTVSQRENLEAAALESADPALSVNEQLEKEMSTANNAPAQLENAPEVELSALDNNATPAESMLARPDADPLVQAQENIVIPAMDTTIPNEEQVNVSEEVALAPLAPEARAVNVETVEAVEEASATEAPLAPVTPIETSEPDNTFTSSSSDYAVVYGFGQDMPLALAVQQIVPEGYAYSFTKSVNLGTRVNWEGDRAWNVVLNDALGSVGLKSRIAGNAVTITQISDQLTSSSNPVIKDHPEAKTFDVMWDLEPAAGADNNSAALQPAPVDALIAPLAPVSPDSENSPEILSKKTIKDPGEMPTQQPAMNGAALEGQAQDTKISDASASVLEDITEDVSLQPITDTASKNGVWSAEKGQSLKKVLYSWSQKGDVQIVWEAAHDYIVENDVHVEGSLDEAMVTLFKVSMAEENYPSVRIIQSQKNSGKTAMVIVQDPAATTNAQVEQPTASVDASEG